MCSPEGGGPQKEKIGPASYGLSSGRRGNEGNANTGETFLVENTQVLEARWVFGGQRGRAGPLQVWFLGG